MTEQEMIQQQISMQSKISLVDKIKLDDIKTVTGIDSAYLELNGKEYVVCCAVTLDRETKTVVSENREVGEVSIRYISGLLSFREEEITLKTLNNLRKVGDVIFFDGNGILHERKMGIATHAGILLDKPTIGVAKTYYKIFNIKDIEVGKELFSYKDIEVDGFVYGRVMRTRQGCKPVYISCGNHITLESATELVKEFTKEGSRIPLPTRYADINTHMERKSLLEQFKSWKQQ